MSKWALVFTSEAENNLRKLDKNLQARIIEKLDWLRLNFDKIKPSALGSEWQGFFKIRIGIWRIIYKVEWEKNLITIWIIDRRDKVYKKANS